MVSKEKSFDEYFFVEWKQGKMKNKKSKQSQLITVLTIKPLVLILILVFSIGLLGGCNLFSGYTDQSLYPEGIKTVYVEMIQSQSFRRGSEYKVTDALAKQIEVATPYKIVSARDRADSVISGRLSSSAGGIMTTERETGSSLEQEMKLTVTVNWKNLKTGELLIDNKEVTGAATYSRWQDQGIEYGLALAANRAAENIVELMEKEW